jgi:hypothetical protein
VEIEERSFVAALLWMTAKCGRLARHRLEKKRIVGSGTRDESEGEVKGAEHYHRERRRKAGGNGKYEVEE